MEELVVGRWATIKTARAGVTLVELLVVLVVSGVLMGLTASAVQRARGLACRLGCANNLRQLGIALQQYHDTFQYLPPGVSRPNSSARSFVAVAPEADPYPLLNWGARLLPFVGEEALWRLTQSAYQESPLELKSPPHVGLTTQVRLFACPADGFRVWIIDATGKSPASTSYLGVAGITSANRSGLLYLNSRVAFSAIPDGTSNTLLVGERPPGLKRTVGRWYGGFGPWGIANAFLGVQESLPGLPAFECPRGPYHFSDDRLENDCSVYHFWSQHPGGANFLFADGAVHFLSDSADAVIAAFATRAGGEVVSPP